MPLLKRAVLLLALAFAATFAAATPASAFEKSIWGPAQLNGKSQFPIYRDLGVDLFQQSLIWANIAQSRPADPTNPNDPAYTWPADLDFAVAEAARYKIDVLLLAMRTPKWANGDKLDVFPPTDAKDYANFMVALAKRYPTVHHFMVWGEPIRNTNYAVIGGSAPNYYDPNTVSPKKLPDFNAGQKASARSYAQLVDATYGSLKRLSKRNIIIGGNTTTSGDLDPFNWFKYMRLSNGKPPRMDWAGHNPFGTRGPDLKKKQLFIGTADMSDLDVFIPWVKRYQSRSGRNKKIKLFVSEFSAPTDQAGFEFNYFVTRPLQAKWLTAAMNIGKRNKDIAGVGWYSLRDVPPREDGEDSRTGLIDNTGKKKPSYYAFKRA